MVKKYNKNLGIKDLEHGKFQEDVNGDIAVNTNILNVTFLTILTEIKCLMADNNKLLKAVVDHLEIVTDEEP